MIPLRFAFNGCALLIVSWGRPLDDGDHWTFYFLVTRWQEWVWGLEAEHGSTAIGLGPLFMFMRWAPIDAPARLR